MRKSLIASCAVLAFFCHSALRAEEPKTIIEKCIKATGGVEKLSRMGGQSKTTGTLEILNSVNFAQEVIFQLPNKFKEVLEMEVNGQKVKVTTTYNGKDVTIDVNGQKLPLDEKQLAEIKEAAHMMQVGRLIYLKDKKYELSSLGESKVNDNAAEGIKVATKGFRDVNLYFDKKSGLLTKIERRAMDFMTQQELSEERIITEYQDIDGMKVPKKVLVNRDGKKFMEAEVQEFKSLDKVDDSTFEQ